MGYANSAPFEIIAFPYQLWVAPLGTAFPNLWDVPAAPWVAVGTNQDLNYSDEGVTVSHAQEMFLFRALGDSASRKAFRTSEDLKIRLMLVDLTLEQYSYALNGNTVTPTSGVMGTSPSYVTMGLSRGFAVATHAVLIRGASPYGDDMVLQYEMPRGAQTGNPEPVYRKDAVALLALEWTGLVDPNAATIFERLGRLRAQTTINS